jgi:hypothetical protein
VDAEDVISEATRARLVIRGIGPDFRVRLARAR